MSPDEPIDLMPTAKAIAALDVEVVRVGDVVRVGKGRRLWTVTDFWGTDGEEPFAALKPLEGYTTSSARVSRLTVVERRAEP